MNMVELSQRRIPRQACQLLIALEGKAFIAGGYARALLAQNGEASDIDIFTRDENQFTPHLEADGKSLRQSVCEIIESLGYGQPRTLPNAIEYKLLKHVFGPEPLLVQAIKPFNNGLMKTFGRPEQVLGQFDFTIAKAAIWFDQGKFFALTGDSFYTDNEQKQLHIEHINCPIAVSLRVAKYCRKGYQIGAREIVKLFVEWNNRPQEYRERLIELCEQDELTPLEAEEIERLLRID